MSLLTTGEAFEVLNSRVERESEFIKSIWKIVRWQTAYMWNLWNKKKVVPTDLVKFDDEIITSKPIEFPKEAIADWDKLCAKVMANKMKI